MDTVEFGRTLMERYLRERHLVYLVGGDGNFCVKFANHGQASVTSIVFSMEGPEGNVAVVRACTSMSFAPDEHARLTEFADGWNRTRRWPKAFTTVGVDGASDIVGEFSWWMDTDFPPGLFDRWISVAMDSCVALFEELTARPLPPTAAELDSWLSGR